MKNGYSIYIVFGGKKLVLPVNPEELEIHYPTDHKTYDILEKGQVVVPGKPSLKTVSWEGFFPLDLSAPYVNSGAKAPEDYVAVFEKALKKKQKGRLIISRSENYDTNMRCVVSDFQTTDKGGEPGDVYYTIELTEYRPYHPKTIVIVTSPQNPDIPETQSMTVETPRPVETPVLRVGAAVVVNGAYCYDSFGAKPHGTANNLSTTVTRIVSGNPYPIHVGSYGWVQESQLQITG